MAMVTHLRSYVAIGVLVLMVLGGVLTAGAFLPGDDGPATPRAWAPKDTDWTQFRHDAARSGLTSANATMRFAYYKWTARTGGSVYSSPAVASLRTTSNGTDVVVGSYDGRLYCINGMNGNIRWRYQAGAAIFSSPAIGDINGDSRPEVVFGCDDGRIYAVNGEDGTLLWRYTTRAPVWSSPALADLNGDGQPEAVVGGLDGKVYALLGSGALLWSATTPLSEWDSGIQAAPSVADINGDGALEVVVPAGDWNVYALKGSDGSRLWSHSLGTPLLGSDLYSSALLTDLDLDNQVEVVVGSNDQTLYCLNGKDGSEKWTHPDLGTFYSAPAAAHIDYDGAMEIFVAFSSTMACIDGSTGDIEWERNFTSIIDSSPALADVDGDGGLEVVFGGYDRVLRALNAETGTPAWAYPCPNSIYSSPAVADIDRDGKVEVVVGCIDSRVYAVDYNF